MFQTVCLPAAPISIIEGKINHKFIVKFMLPNFCLPLPACQYCKLLKTNYTPSYFYRHGFTRHVGCANEDLRALQPAMVCLETTFKRVSD